MASIDDIRRLLENRSLTSARELEAMEDNQEPIKVKVSDDNTVEENGLVLRSESFVRAWNSLGKEIKVREGNAFPLGQGEMLEVSTGVSLALSGKTVGIVCLSRRFLGDTGLTLVGSPVVESGGVNIRLTNVRKDLAIVELGKVIGTLSLVGEIEYLKEKS